MILDDAPRIVDWAWVDTAKLGPGQSGGRGEKAYNNLLAGRAVRDSLVEVADLAARIYNEFSTSPQSS